MSGRSDSTVRTTHKSCPKWRSDKIRIGPELASEAINEAMEGDQTADRALAPPPFPPPATGPGHNPPCPAAPGFVSPAP